MKRPTELIEKAKGFKSTDPIRVLAEYILSCEPQPPRKTVSDAVDYYDGFWPHEIRNVLSWCSKERLWFFGMPINGQYKVCTREEFEAEVERRKGECQYEDAFGDDCEILIGKEDDIGRIIIRRNNGQYAIVAKSSVKKRKPPITHKEIIEMMERAAFVNWTVADFMQHIHDDFELVD